MYLKKFKKSIKSYFDSKEVKSDRLLLACYTVMSSFQSCYFLNCLPIMWTVRYYHVFLPLAWFMDL